jgi:hypothetical protein
VQERRKVGSPHAHAHTRVHIQGRTPAALEHRFDLLSMPRDRLSRCIVTRSLLVHTAAPPQPFKTAPCTLLTPCVRLTSPAHARVHLSRHLASAHTPGHVRVRVPASLVSLCNPPLSPVRAAVRRWESNLRPYYCPLLRGARSNRCSQRLQHPVRVLAG